MNIGMVNLLVCMSVASISQQTYTNETVSVENNISTKDVLVVLSTEESLKWKDYTVDDFKEVECTSVEDLTSSYKNQKILKKDFKRILKLSFGEKEVEEVYNIIDELSAKQGIEYAGPNYELIGEASNIDTTARYISRTVTSVDENWGIDRINVPEAKSLIEDCTKKDVYVGVLENGIDGSHFDLQPNISSNLSISFVEENNNYDENDESDPLFDYTSDSHGTMVAGIIAGNKNINEGTEGVCENAILVSLKINSSDGYDVLNQTPIVLNADDLVMALNHANQKNIRILNYSSAFNVYDYSIEIAVNNYSGLIVCGAGNDGKNIDNNYVYPASFDTNNILVVGGIEQDNSILSEIFIEYGVHVNICSNYGQTNVDLFAPGAYIKSTTKNNSYDIECGTSFSAPFVSGLAAMLLSIKEKTYSKHLSAAELKGIIMDSVDVTSGLANYCVTGGVVNAEKAVELALSYVPSFGYSQYDSVYHIVEPTYGENYFEEHSYLPFLDKMGTVTPYALPRLPKFKCEKCGALKVGL